MQAFVQFFIMGGWLPVAIVCYYVMLFLGLNLEPGPDYADIDRQLALPGKSLW